MGVSRSENEESVCFWRANEQGTFRVDRANGDAKTETRKNRADITERNKIMLPVTFNAAVLTITIGSAER